MTVLICIHAGYRRIIGCKRANSCHREWRSNWDGAIRKVTITIIMLYKAKKANRHLLYAVAHILTGEVHLYYKLSAQLSSRSHCLEVRRFRSIIHKSRCFTSPRQCCVQTSIVKGMPQPGFERFARFRQQFVSVSLRLPTVWRRSPRSRVVPGQCEGRASGLQYHAFSPSTFRPTGSMSVCGGYLFLSVQHDQADPKHFPRDDKR